MSGETSNRLKVYCEHGAITKQLLEYQRQGLVELVYFPYDPGSVSKRLARTAVPSNARWIDMHMPWSEYNDAWSEYRGSEHYESIVLIVGHQNRRDALHLDSAYKSKCIAFITRDRRDILNKRTALQELLGLLIFNSDSDAAELRRFIIEQPA